MDFKGFTKKQQDTLKLVVGILFMFLGAGITFYFMLENKPDYSALTMVFFIIATIAVFNPQGLTSQIINFGKES